MKNKYTLRKRKFSVEFKRQLRFGIAAAVGFSIAFAWREPLSKFMQDFVVKYTEANVPYYVSVTSALMVTFFGVLILWLSARLLK